MLVCFFVPWPSQFWLEPSEHPFCMVSCVGSLRAVAEFWNAPLALLCSWTLCRGSTSTRRVWSSQTWWKSPSALRAPGWPQSRRVKKWLTPSYSWSCGSTMRKYRGNDSSWPCSCQSHKSLHRHCPAKAESFQIWEVTMHTAAQHRVALSAYRKKLLWIYLEESETTVTMALKFTYFLGIKSHGPDRMVL